MKKLLALVLAVVMLSCCFILVSCKKDTGSADSIADTMTSSDGKYVIAMVTDVGQLKDKSFNQGTWDGVKLYAHENGKSYKYYQPANGDKASDEDRYNAFVAAINGGAQIIVTPGFLQAGALTKAAVEYPDVKFVFIDGWALTTGDGAAITNVAAVSFQEEQCGYLAGYACVVEGYTKLGFTGGGGGTNPAVNRYGYGFAQGARDAAKEAGVSVELTYSFLYGEGYSASPELQTMVNGWYAGGTQCVFACGGSMCSSVFAAAATNEAVSVGVDVDQSGESETVITSAEKGLASAGQKILGMFFDGKWDEVGGKCSNLGVDDNAVGLPFATSKFDKFTETKYNSLVSSMKSGGSLTVDSDYATFTDGTVTMDSVTFRFVK